MALQVLKIKMITFTVFENSQMLVHLQVALDTS